MLETFFIICIYLLMQQPRSFNWTRPNTQTQSNYVSLSDSQCSVFSYFFFFILLSLCVFCVPQTRLDFLSTDDELDDEDDNDDDHDSNKIQFWTSPFAKPCTQKHFYCLIQLHMHLRERY